MRGDLNIRNRLRGREGGKNFANGNKPVRSRSVYTANEIKLCTEYGQNREALETKREVTENRPV